MHLSLYQFKSFREKTLDLSESLQVVVGNNGAGKSTLCEALSIMANASNSHHTSWSEKSSFKVGEKIEDTNNESNLRKQNNQSWALRLQLGEHFFQALFDGSPRSSSGVAGKSVSPKWHIGENSVSKPKYEDMMPYRAIWIQSDHLRVISGEPSERRNFLDDMLTFASPVYAKIQRNYRTALTSRNKIISLILDREATKSDLSSWNTMLAEYAVQVIMERRKFFAWLRGAPLTRGVVEDRGVLGTLLSQGGKLLHLPGPVKIDLAERHPLAEVTKESFLELLKHYTERDLVVGRTTIGPHLDEIEFLVNLNPPEKGGVGGLENWQPTKHILSRGENKILLLAFIRLLGEYVRETSGKQPLFLLDDVLSELDENHTKILCDLFADTTTIMTTQPNHTAGLPANINQVQLG